MIGIAPVRSTAGRNRIGKACDGGQATEVRRAVAAMIAVDRIAVGARVSGVGSMRFSSFGMRMKIRHDFNIRGEQRDNDQLENDLNHDAKYRVSAV